MRTIIVLERLISHYSLFTTIYLHSTKDETFVKKKKKRKRTAMSLMTTIGTNPGRNQRNFAWNVPDMAEVSRHDRGRRSYNGMKFKI